MNSEILVEQFKSLSLHDQVTTVVDFLKKDLEVRDLLQVLDRSKLIALQAQLIIELENHPEDIQLKIEAIVKDIRDIIDIWDSVETEDENHIEGHDLKENIPLVEAIGQEITDTERGTLDMIRFSVQKNGLLDQVATEFKNKDIPLRSTIRNSLEKLGELEEFLRSGRIAELVQADEELRSQIQASVLRLSDAYSGAKRERLNEVSERDVVEDNIARILSLTAASGVELRLAA